MKKTFTYALFGVLAIVTTVQAAFIDKGTTEMSVANAKEMKDNTPVRLKGNVIQNLGDEKYLFTDGNQTIIVEIDTEDWGGQDVSAKDTVIITGEIDKDLFGTEIDVEAVQLVQ